MFKKIVRELEHHAPFTVFGALTGIVLTYLFRNMPFETAHGLFYIFHPGHIFLSALVTSAMYKIHKCGPLAKCNIWALFIIGYVGSVGIATISDSLIPFWGETLLNMPNRAPHIGFIEEWWLVNPVAILGIATAYLLPKTKIPHAGHVLLSTWASLFHIIMALAGQISVSLYFWIFIFLFLSVWLPCCVSDIVFPLLFVSKEDK